MGRLIGVELVAPLVAIAAIGFAVTGHEAPRPVSHRVEMSGIAFHPATLRAHVGDTITWVNHDLVPHTSTVKGGWDTGSIAAGDSALVVLRHRGQWQYACSFHPTMKGELTVR